MGIFSRKVKTPANRANHPGRKTGSGPTMNSNPMADDDFDTSSNWGSNSNPDFDKDADKPSKTQKRPGGEMVRERIRQKYGIGDKDNRPDPRSTIKQPDSSTILGGSGTGARPNNENF